MWKKHFTKKKCETWAQIEKKKATSKDPCFST